MRPEKRESKWGTREQHEAVLQKCGSCSHLRLSLGVGPKSQTRPGCQCQFSRQFNFILCFLCYLHVSTKHCLWLSLAPTHLGLSVLLPQNILSVMSGLPNCFGKTLSHMLLHKRPLQQLSSFPPPPPFYPIIFFTLCAISDAELSFSWQDLCPYMLVWDA